MKWVFVLTKSEEFMNEFANLSLIGEIDCDDISFLIGDLEELNNQLNSGQKIDLIIEANSLEEFQKVSKNI